MKVCQINAVCGFGSTGKIVLEVSKLLTAQNVENYVLYASKNSDYTLGIKYADDKQIRWQALRARIFGEYGFNSRKITQKLLAELDKIQPDVVHLHNLHGHNCHLEMLFRYLKERQIKVYWTFHDCWAFTAYCPHFDMIGCKKWKTGCESCPQWRRYSWFFDKSKKLYESKRKLFSGLNLTIVTPSKWLADLVKQSFFKNYPVKVIYNGIDLKIFQPLESNFRKKYRCENKFILLGVAFGWDERKGLDVFIELSKRLDERFQIVLVGTDEKLDKQLPQNIISISRTQDQKELAAIYTAADLFVNPTREEVLGLVNIESLACGTPVLTFRTGGSPEIIDETCGTVVDKNNIAGLEKEIIRICEKKPFNSGDCIKRAYCFDVNKKFSEYLELYQV